MIASALTGLLQNIPRAALAPLRLWQRARACPPGSWVHLEIDGELVEVHRGRPALPWGPRPTGLALDRLRQLVDELIADRSPAGLVVTIRSLAGGAALRTALRAELLRLRVSGRTVVVHLPLGGGPGELLVASAASRVLLGVQTTLGPMGFSAGSVYLRRALDRAGIEPDIHARGDFKTAGENLARDEMSGPQREQVGRLLDVLHGELVEALREGRRVSHETASAWLDRGLISADDALREGLVDALVHDDEALKSLGATPRTDDAATAGAGMYLWRRRQRAFVPIRPRPAIAIIEAHGPIIDKAPRSGGKFCDAVSLVKLIDAAADAPHVAGVVLHVDSPGGGVLASEKIHRAVSRLSRKKTIVASFGSVAASGGYYVASGCHAIVARETTVTGSIGVVAARVLVHPLLERLGLRHDVITRGAHADMMRPTRPFDPAERELFAAELERAYRRFLSLVADGRHRRVDEIEPLAGGRVWSGRDAFERGLVDRLGGLDAAVDEVRLRGKLSVDAEPVLWRAPPRWTLRPLLDLMPWAAEAREALGPWAALPDLARALMVTREPFLAIGWPWPGP